MVPSSFAENQNEIVNGFEILIVNLDGYPNISSDCLSCVLVVGLDAPRLIASPEIPVVWYGVIAIGPPAGCVTKPVM